MQVVILAAGFAKRLRPITDTIPKCLVKVGEKSFLERMIENLLEYGLHKYVFVLGYRNTQILEFLKKRFPNIQMQYIINDDYETTNNCYSLWMARALVHEDILLLDGDILFDKRIIGLLLNSPYQDCLALNTQIELDEEAMKVKSNGEKMVLEISKEIPVSHGVGESIGIEKFSFSTISAIFQQLDWNITQRGEKHLFYEKTFQDVISKGYPIYWVDIGTLKAIEVDSPEDLIKAEQTVLPFLI